MCDDQGDQIGRIFAFWAVVYFGQFFLIGKKRKLFGLLFSAVQVVCLFNLTKSGLGFILGGFSLAHQATRLSSKEPLKHQIGRCLPTNLGSSKFSSP
jgi:hypothetical protein